MSSDRTRRLKQIDRSRVWHPFTQMRHWPEDDAPIIESAQGCYLIDTEGRRYFDGVSSLWANLHGHCQPEIDRAVIEQLGRVAHSTLLGLGNAPSIELAERLIEIAPAGLTRVFYSDSGSSAVEVALKIAFAYFRHSGQPGRRRFVRFSGSYHGDTLGAVSVGGIETFHGLYRPLLFEAPQAEYPHCYRCERGLEPQSCGLACLQSLEQILDQQGPQTAAVLIEPLIQGAAGMRTAPSGFLAEAARLTRAAGALLICDEVATGFGRTGSMFACEQEGVSPDLLTLAKGLSGGYLPLAATLATERIYEAFLGGRSELRTFFHGHTYTGNPLACAAALASLRLFQEQDVLKRLQPKIALFNELLQGFYEHRIVGEVRARGLMAGVELTADRASKRPFLIEMQVGRRVIEQARERGVILRPLGDVLVFMPPLAASEQELRLLVAVGREALSAVEDSLV